MAEGGDGDVRRGLHQCQFRRGLAHTHLTDHRIGADNSAARYLLPEPVEEEEAIALLHPDPRPRQSPLGEKIGDQFERLLILVPGSDFGVYAQLLGD